MGQIGTAQLFAHRPLSNGQFCLCQISSAGGFAALADAFGNIKQ